MRKWEAQKSRPSKRLKDHVESVTELALRQVEMKAKGWS